MLFAMSMKEREVKSLAKNRKYGIEANMLIRRKVTETGLRMWQVADLLGIRPDTFSTQLRHELPSEEQERIIAVIEAYVNAYCDQKKGDV